MKLPDREIEAIIQRLKQGKPLPERYRFLLFENKGEPELVWDGKTDEACDIVWPFAPSERFDCWGSSCIAGNFQQPLAREWKNKLFWSDNKFVLAALSHGTLRAEIEALGGIQLVYIDPPFGVGTNFSIDIEMGDETEIAASLANPSQTKRKKNTIEQIAYFDTWGKGADSWLAMLYERLALIQNLLAEEGSIYVHCDWRSNAYIRLVLDEIFGKEAFRNEIVWCYRGGGVPKKDFAPKHDTIFRYTKSKGDRYQFHLDRVRIPYSQDVLSSSASRYDKSYRAKKIYDGYKPHPLGKHPEDWWTIQPLMPSDKTERIGYPTQKPVELLQRIIEASTNPEDLILDAFCGSGTTLAVAAGLRVERVKNSRGKEKLSYFFAPPRKWIGIDSSKFSIHAVRKRLIGLHRQLQAEGKYGRTFEIFHAERYERQYFYQQTHATRSFFDLILRAYGAEPTNGFEKLQGKKGKRFVAIAPLGESVTRSFFRGSRFGVRRFFEKASPARSSD